MKNVHHTLVGQGLFGKLRLFGKLLKNQAAHICDYYAFDS